MLEPSEDQRRSHTGVGSAPTSRLPILRSLLIGRDTEQASLATLLTRADVALVTLTGAGCVGKTRLALQVAHNMRADFHDGVYLVPLAPVRDPALVGAEVARALGAQDVSGRPLVERLGEFLANRRILLVLDNFEHVLPASTLISDLLTACPSLKVLATSRAPLRLRAERECVVEPLPLPAAPGRTAALESPAVALFVRLAQDTSAERAVTDADLALVVELCSRLDGLPLALELAAARLKLLSLGALVRRLERRLPLLTRGARDLPARQQTLRATIAWSYDVLSSAEQQLFRRLAVFAGGSTPQAVSAVCLDAPRSEITLLDRLSALADQHLLVRNLRPMASRDS